MKVENGIAVMSEKRFRRAQALMKYQQQLLRARKKTCRDLDAMVKQLARELATERAKTPSMMARLKGMIDATPGPMRESLQVICRLFALGETKHMNRELVAMFMRDRALRNEFEHYCTRDRFKILEAKYPGPWFDV